MIRITLEANIDPKILDGNATRLERALAWQIHKDTIPFLPALTLSLTQRSRVQGNHIIYPGPYARYLWYGKVMVNALTGKGPMYIPDVGYRWPRGAILKPTERDLKFNTSVHADATSHWMDVSRKRNMKKWERMGATFYTNGR